MYDGKTTAQANIADVLKQFNNDPLSRLPGLKEKCLAGEYFYSMVIMGKEKAYIFDFSFPINAVPREQFFGYAQKIADNMQRMGMAEDKYGGKC